MSETTLRTVRLALASLLAVALASQLLIGLSRDEGLTVVRFFSYFTVLSNALAVVALVMLAGRPGRDHQPGFASYRGAVTVYMAVTGLVYAVVLAPNLADVAVPEPWIDWAIHVVGPVAMAADWFLHPPTASLSRVTLLLWLAFPTAYLAYSLTRGPLVDWYPYPFLDPSETGGYRGVAMWAGVVLVVILGFGLLVRWWPSRKRAETGTG